MFLFLHLLEIASSVTTMPTYPVKWLHDYFRYYKREWASEEEVQCCCESMQRSSFERKSGGRQKQKWHQFILCILKEDFFFPSGEKEALVRLPSCYSWSYPLSFGGKDNKTLVKLFCIPPLFLLCLPSPFLCFLYLTCMYISPPPLIFFIYFPPHHFHQSFWMKPYFDCHFHCVTFHFLFDKC